MHRNLNEFAFNRCCHGYTVGRVTDDVAFVRRAAQDDDGALDWHERPTDVTDGRDRLAQAKTQSTRGRRQGMFWHEKYVDTNYWVYIEIYNTK